MSVSLKRIYQPASQDDGFRVLVDRVWPRGVGKEEAELHEWAKDLAPSAELRTWFGHRPERWAEFRQRYLTELANPDLAKRLDALRERARDGHVTLLYGAKDEERNQAVVLAEVLRGDA